MEDFKAPWLGSYGDIPAHLEYPDCSISDLLEQSAKQYADEIAYDFMGHTNTFRRFWEKIEDCARGLHAIGIGEGDCVSICMPNAPQALILFYAINRIGGIASMVHPLSSEGELKFYLNVSKSVAVLTLDQFYPKIKAIRAETGVRHVIVTGIGDALSALKKFGYAVTQGRRDPKVPKTDDVMRFSELMALGRRSTETIHVPKKADDGAVILYSGGTTGTSKGVLLTNGNFNALAVQIIEYGKMQRHCSVLAILPIFHGFGLGVSVHSMLVGGTKCILIPRFSAKAYPKLLKAYKPNYIAGVPTLFEAMVTNSAYKKLDLSCLKGVFSGGDSLPAELKERVDAFFRDHGAQIQVREGYGATECIAAVCLTPEKTYRAGSIGVPMPDDYIKIVEIGTQEEIAYGEMGEICISGPTVMKEYIGQPQETAQTIQRHADGRLWLHTGDLGKMDADGYVYFKQRLKRMIVTSGYNVYPSQIESVIDAIPEVAYSTVIGVPDPYKMQKPKAFIVLRPGVEPSRELEEKIRACCKKNVARYAMPREFEFRSELPHTSFGKVAYRQLELEEARKAKEAAQTKN